MTAGSQPRLLRRVIETSLSQSAVEGVGFVEKVGDEQVQPPVTVGITGCDAHGPLSPTVAVEPGPGHQPVLVKRHRPGPRIGPVAVKEIRPRVVGHEDTQAAGILVEAGHNQAQPLSTDAVDTGRTGHVSERAITLAQVQPVGRGRKLERLTHPGSAAEVATHARVDVGSGEVIDHVKIGHTVSVDVGDGTAGRPPVTGHAGGSRRVDKRPVPVVVVQPVFADVAHVQVRPAVSVKIPNGHALPEPGRRQPGLLGDVLEPSVSQVAEQPIGVNGRRQVHRPGGPLGEIQVGPAIAVEVQHRHSTAGELEHLLARPIRITTVDVFHLHSGR